MVLENNLITAATEYIRRGWRVVPTIPDTAGNPKRPINPYAQDGKGWEKLNLGVEDVHMIFGDPKYRGIGLILGPISDDLVDIDLDSDEALVIAPRFLPSTRMISGHDHKPRSHYWYMCEGAVHESFVSNGKKIVEMRSSQSKTGEVKAQQTVVPPTVRADGSTTRWETDTLEPARVEYTTLRRAVLYMCTAIVLARHWPDGDRHYAAMAAAGMLLRGGLDEETVYHIIDGAREVTPDEDWRRRSDLRDIVHDTARRLERGEPTTGAADLTRRLRDGPQVTKQICEWLGIVGGITNLENLTDVGNAKRLLRLHGQDIRYTPERGGYATWNGKVWRWDDAPLRRWAEDVAHELRAEFPTAAERVANAKTEDERRKAIEYERALRAWARYTESTRGIDAMLKHLQVLVERPPPDAWDAQHDLITCESGTIDLRTGEIRTPSRDDLVSKYIPLKFDTNSKCPRWLQFINEITSRPGEDGRLIPRPALADYLRAAIGYTLTGRIAERVIFVLYGRGKNGKSLLLKVLEHMLGEYASTTLAHTFVSDDSETKHELARLCGVRFVSVNETSEGSALNEGIIKIVTGGDSVTGRELYRPAFVYTPRWKLFIATNNLPRIEGRDDAIWDRIRVLPFEVRFDGDREDKKLASKLADELTGIFSLAVADATRYYAHGLPPPPSEVMLATTDYRKKENIVQQFIDDEAVITNAANDIVPVKEMAERFAEWQKELGYNKLRGGRYLSERLTEMNLQKRHGRSGWVWWGIRLLSEEEKIARAEREYDAISDGDSDNYLLTRARVREVTAVADPNGVRVEGEKEGGRGRHDNRELPGPAPQRGG
ncbi:MAG: phage/plasmid primase, P4 family [Thermoplasmata archaeon]